MVVTHNHNRESHHRRLHRRGTLDDYLFWGSAMRITTIAGTKTRESRRSQSIRQTLAGPRVHLAIPRTPRAPATLPLRDSGEVGRLVRY